MDKGNSSDIQKIVVKLTTTGKDVLEEATLKKLKHMCRASDESLIQTYEALIAQLHKKHAEVRLATFHVVSELFSRSHVFRNLLIKDLQLFLELTLGFEVANPLPPPKVAAEKLREKTLQTLELWDKKYGSGYPKLSLGCEWLKSCKQVDFANRRAQSETERLRQAEEEERQRIRVQNRLDRLYADMKDKEDDMKQSLVQLSNCFEILLPTPAAFNIYDAFDTDLNTTNKSKGDNENDKRVTNDALCPSENVPWRSEDCKNDDADGEVDGLERVCGGDKNTSDQLFHGDESDSDDELVEDASDGSQRRLHGIVNKSVGIVINLNDVGVSENDDNRAVMGNVRELMHVVDSKHLPTLTKWLAEMTKVGANEDDVKRLIDLKVKFTDAKRKFSDLQITPLTTWKQTTVNTGDNNDENDDDDDDFEEVPEKEGYEPVIPPHRRKEYGLEPLPQVPHSHLPTRTDWHLGHAHTKDDLADPTSMAANLAKRNLHKVTDPRPCSSKTSDASSSAPTVTGGYDIDNWGNPNPDAPMPSRPVMLHPFWHTKEAEDRPTSHNMAALEERAITFTGSFEPVKWTCRAPLDNGQLCPRMDRYKCPFHGTIVARDNMGQPSNDEARKVADKQQESQRKASTTVGGWDDPELQADIEAAIGVDLGSQRSKGKGRGKGSKRKFPHLTDLNAPQKTSRARLEKIIFNKTSLKKVSATLDRADHKRHGDKYANQFNYLFDK